MPAVPTRFTNQCCAFVGLAQACGLVHSTASGHDPEPASYSGLYRALLEQNPSDTSDLFGLGDFSYGRTTAYAMLGRSDEDQLQSLRYTLAVIDASNRLRRYPLVVEQLAAGVSNLPSPKCPETNAGASKTQAEIQPETQPETNAVTEAVTDAAVQPAAAVALPTAIPTWDMPWEQIAELYIETLGTLDSRIQVTGNASILQRPDVASKIRSLLLMGVRFAWLWRQLGGRRWHLLTHRNRIRSTIESLEF